MRHRGRVVGHVEDTGRFQVFVFVATLTTQLLVVGATPNNVVKDRHTRTRGFGFVEALYADDGANPSIKSLVKARLRPEQNRDSLAPVANKTSLISKAAKSAKSDATSASASRGQTEEKNAASYRHMAMLGLLIFSLLTLGLVTAMANLSNGVKKERSQVPVQPWPDDGVADSYADTANSNCTGTATSPSIAGIGRPKRGVDTNATVEAGPVFFAMDADNHLVVEEDDTLEFVLSSPMTGKAPACSDSASRQWAAQKTASPSRISRCASSPNIAQRACSTSDWLSGGPGHCIRAEAASQMEAKDDMPEGLFPGIFSSAGAGSVHEGVRNGAIHKPPRHPSIESIGKLTSRPPMHGAAESMDRRLYPGVAQQLLTPQQPISGLTPRILTCDSQPPSPCSSEHYPQPSQEVATLDSDGLADA